MFAAPATIGAIAASTSSASPHEVTQIIAVADVGDSLQGTHFAMEDGTGSVGVYLDAGCPEITQFDFTGLTGASFVVGSGVERMAVDSPDTNTRYVFRVDTDPDAVDEYVPSGATVVPVEFLSTDAPSDLAATFAAAFAGGTAVAVGAVVTLTRATDFNETLSVSLVSYATLQQGHDDASPPGGFARTIRVPYLTNDGENDVALALKTALDADAAFSATVVADTVAVTDAATGPRTDAADVDTGFAISILTQGA